MTALPDLIAEYGHSLTGGFDMNRRPSRSLTDPRTNRRALALARKIPQAVSDAQKKKRIHAWAEFITAALKSESTA